MNQYLNSLENSGWLQHIKSILDAAICITQVKKNQNHKISLNSFIFRRLSTLNRLMFLFILPMVGIVPLNVVHYHLFFFVLTIDPFMDFE